MKHHLLQALSLRRIKPEDGLAVTAEVWEEAHEYHRQNQRQHVLFSHGSGVVTGLNVIASDPPDNYVFVQPGIAVDPDGQTILLTEPIAYDVGDMAHGLLWLLLTYSESAPRPGPNSDGPAFIHAEFTLQALSSLPDSPWVELARVNRSNPQASISNATNDASPAQDEIDLRFRRRIGAMPRLVSAIGVCYVGNITDSLHGHGANQLANAIRNTSRRLVWVDDGISIMANLDAYTALFLVGEGNFELPPDEMTALHNYLEGGGTIFAESCRREVDGDDSQVDSSLLDLMSSLGVKLQLKELPSGHPLLVQPNFFATLPQGFETEAPPQLLLGNGVVLSSCDYGCLWQGDRRGRVATREEIRSATEWGENLVTYAMERRLGQGGRE